MAAQAVALCYVKQPFPERPYMPERVGVSVAPTKQIPVHAISDLAGAAERLGYDSIWVPETWGQDAATLLAILAVRTDRIRLASGVFNVFSRSAALLAQTAASLQEMSGGRFVLGLGTSGPIVVEGWHGVPFRNPIVRTREYVEVIRLALSGQTVDFAGTELRLERFRLLNPPAAEVPIYIAALGPRNVRLTGQVADGWLPIFAARGHMAPLLAELRTGMALAGRQPDEADVAAYLPVAIGRDGERLLRQQLAYYVGGMGSYYHGFVARLGLEEEANMIRSRWEGGRHREAMAAVTEEMLALCTLGTEAGAARERLAEYRADGVSLPILAFPHGSTIEIVQDTLAALAPVG